MCGIYGVVLQLEIKQIRELVAIQQLLCIFNFRAFLFGYLPVAFC
jgi:hypothetical protein